MKFRLSIFLFVCLFTSLAWGGVPPERSSTATNNVALFENGGETDFLKPEQAFKLSIQALDPSTLIADFEVSPGYYLYRDRISFKPGKGLAFTIASVDLPKGEMKHDPNFGDMEVYHRPFQATLHLKQPSPVPGSLILLASYQGCSEKGLCYAPIRKTFDIALGEIASPLSSQPSNESDQMRKLLGSGRLWLIAAVFFGSGLLLAFTPCVFPMIPILSGIIVGQGKHPTRMHAFNLSLAYTLGMAITYALAGIAAGLSGHLISNALQNPWALGFGAALFVILALSMFGLYELRLPAGLETRVSEAANRIRGGRFLGVFAMGALSALIVSPCVAAPIAGALLYIGQTHDVVLGGVALFSLALGMGVPLLAVGLSAGTLLPKAGPWMNVVRNFFGIVMLGMAIWLISPVIPVALQMILWAALLIVPAIYLHALDGLPPHSGKLTQFGKGIGILALVAGIALLVGAFSGSKDPLRPLAGLVSGSGTSAENTLPFRRVQNASELDDALRQSKGRYVMLDFYADWCVSCKEYERYTFADPRVRRLLADSVLLQADVTRDTDEDSRLKARFGVVGPPSILFFDQNGLEISSARVVGYQDAAQFLVTLNSVFASRQGACPKALEC